jgi:hypothetical protein
VKTAEDVPRLIFAMGLVLVLTRWPSPASWRRPRRGGKSPAPGTIDHGFGTPDTRSG